MEPSSQLHVGMISCFIMSQADTGSETFSFTVKILLPTTRIPNSSSCSPRPRACHENLDCYISEKKRAIRDPLVSKQPEKI